MTRVYFSNGTHWELWSRHWCDRCVHDHQMHHSETEVLSAAGGCPLVLSMMCQMDEPELVGDGESMTCARFKQCRCP